MKIIPRCSKRVLVRGLALLKHVRAQMAASGFTAKTVALGTSDAGVMRVDQRGVLISSECWTIVASMEGIGLSTYSVPARIIDDRLVMVCAFSRWVIFYKNDAGVWGGREQGEDGRPTKKADVVVPPSDTGEVWSSLSVPGMTTNADCTKISLIVYSNTINYIYLAALNYANGAWSLSRTTDLSLVEAGGSFGNLVSLFTYGNYNGQGATSHVYRSVAGEWSLVSSVRDRFAGHTFANTNAGIVYGDGNVAFTQSVQLNQNNAADSYVTDLYVYRDGAYRLASSSAQTNVHSTAISADGSTTAGPFGLYGSGASLGIISVYQSGRAKSNTHTLVASPIPSATAGFGINSILLSEDGRTLVAYLDGYPDSYPSNYMIWSCADGSGWKDLTVALNMAPNCAALNMSSDGRTVSVQRYTLNEQGYQIETWFTELYSCATTGDWKHVATLTNAQRYTSFVGISADGRTVGFKTTESRFELWSCITGEWLHIPEPDTFSSLNRYGNGIFSDDGVFVLTSNTYCIRLRNKVLPQEKQDESIDEKRLRYYSIEDKLPVFNQLNRLYLTGGMVETMPAQTRAPLTMDAIRENNAWTIKDVFEPNFERKKVFQSLSTQAVEFINKTNKGVIPTEVRVTRRTSPEGENKDLRVVVTTDGIAVLALKR